MVNNIIMCLFLLQRPINTMNDQKLPLSQLFTQNCSQLPLGFTTDAEVKSPHKSPPPPSAAAAVALLLAAGGGAVGAAAKSPSRSPTEELDEGL